MAVLGLFTTRTLAANEPLGVYRGKIRRTLPQTADEEYVWAVSRFAQTANDAGASSVSYLDS